MPNDQNASQAATLTRQAAAVRLALSEINLLDRAAAEPQEDVADQLPLARAFAMDTQEIISKRAIVAVGTDKSKGVVIVYTNRAYAKRDHDTIRSKISEDLPIIFRTLGLGNQGPGAVALEELPQPQLRNDRITCGTSISVGNDRGAGTLGALVVNPGGEIFGLSCSHVISGCGYIRSGMPILAPGVMDVVPDWPDPRVIGHFESALPLVAGDPRVVGKQRNLDAALFRISDLNSVSSFQGKLYDTPTKCYELSEDDEGILEIEKVGRSTGHTEGVVQSQINGAMEIVFSVTSYPEHGQSRKFDATVFVDQLWVATSTGPGFAKPGDSGALVVTRPVGRRVRRAVGLIVAGTKEEQALILPIGPVLEEFGVKLLSEHQVT